jgi:cytoskeletal protein CcmA (bactofilin family)
MTVIGRDTKIKGEMQFEGGARILGTFEGKITAAGEVQIGAGANCNAAVEAERVIVDGNINGDITASEVLTLNAEAKVEGDIVATKLVVIEGATFIGNCRVGPAKGAARTAPARANASTPAVPSATRPLPEPTIETRVGSLHTVDAA